MELTRAEWTSRAEAHRARLAPYVQGHLNRRGRGVKHPVHDFLFSYYAHRPAELLRWHPGYGVRLVDAPEYDAVKGYRAGAVTASFLRTRLDLIHQIRTLLVATADRPANLGCFGLHEWAMVHRADRYGTRHEWPLRLGGGGTDRVVEGHRIACSHFDAFRFFTPSARPLNTLSPRHDDRPAYEQPGCLHAGMDLYGKVAVRLSPVIASELVADAFELAWDIRILDMRAAPYDLSGITLDPHGIAWTPVAIETADGKREYAELQRGFAERARPIRQRLIAALDRAIDRALGQRPVATAPAKRR